MLLIPFIVNKKFNNLTKIEKYFTTNIIFLISILIIFIIFYELFQPIVNNICFDYPVMIFKDNAPNWCKEFDFSIFSGTGWIIKLIFLSIFEAIYSLFIYFYFKIFKD
jgi:hypothetical protein